METIILDWANREAIRVNDIFITKDEIIIYCNFIHFGDLERLDKLIDGYHVAFVNPHDEESIYIELFKD